MNRRKPFIVEFTGTPEAGKTTIIGLLKENLIKMGYTVKVYPESAKNTPKSFPKGSLEEKLWINFDTSKHILEASFSSDYDIIIFDRGSLDRIFFVYLDNVYNPEIASKCAPFIKLLEPYSPDILVALYVSPEEAIKRRGGEGRLVTNQYITDYNRLLDSFVNSLKLNKLLVSTNNKKIPHVLNIVEDSILETFKSHR